MIIGFLIGFSAAWVLSGIAVLWIISDHDFGRPFGWSDAALLAVTVVIWPVFLHVLYNEVD